MGRVVMLSVVATMGLVASCSSPGDVTGPGQVFVGKPSFTLDCQFDEPQCDLLRAGIEAMLLHANQNCVETAQRALARFEAPLAAGEGFRSGPQGNGDMYVTMTTETSYQPANGYSNVSPSFWVSAAQNPSAILDGATIIHEEKHHDGSDNSLHSTGVAHAFQQACINTDA